MPDLRLPLQLDMDDKLIRLLSVGLSLCASNSVSYFEVKLKVTVPLPLVIIEGSAFIILLSNTTLCVFLRVHKGREQREENILQISTLTKFTQMAHHKQWETFTFLPD